MATRRAKRPTGLVKRKATVKRTRQQVKVANSAARSKQRTAVPKLKRFLAVLAAKAKRGPLSKADAAKLATYTKRLSSYTKNITGVRSNAQAAAAKAGRKRPLVAKRVAPGGKRVLSAKQKAALEKARAASAAKRKKGVRR